MDRSAAVMTIDEMIHAFRWPFWQTGSHFLLFRSLTHLSSHCLGRPVLGFRSGPDRVQRRPSDLVDCDPTPPQSSRYRIHATLLNHSRVCWTAFAPGTRASCASFWHFVHAANPHAGLLAWLYIRRTTPAKVPAASGGCSGYAATSRFPRSTATLAPLRAPHCDLGHFVWEDRPHPSFGYSVCT